jgi:hypothetical protein
MPVKMTFKRKVKVGTESMTLKMSRKEGESWLSNYESVPLSSEVTLALPLMEVR